MKILNIFIKKIRKIKKNKKDKITTEIIDVPDIDEKDNPDVGNLLMGYILNRAKCSIGC